MKCGRALLNELIIFLVVQLLGIFVAYLIFTQKEELIIPELSLLNFAVAFVIATAVILIALKFVKGKMGFKLFFILLIAVGSKTVFSTIFSEFGANILALAVVAAWIFIPYVLMHDIAIIFAIAGISAQLGLAISVPTILILLAVLSVYDVLAVYKTRHMVKMFKTLMDRGVILSIIVPGAIKDFLKKTKTVEPKQGFLLLGTGDLAFPLIFAVSVLTISLSSALFVVAGATLGTMLVYYMLITQPERRALPALPPIAICSFLGFLISLVI